MSDPTEAPEPAPATPPAARPPASTGWLRTLLAQVRAAPRTWVELWDHRERPTSLAMLRILVATVLLVDLLTAWRLDLVEALWSPPPHGFSTASAAAPPFLVRQFGAGPDTAWLAWGLTVGACALVITGTLTRAACIALALLSAQLAYLGPDGDRGIDKLLRVTLLVLALSQSHARWTVDAWVWRKLGRPIGGAAGLIPAWPRYLLILQLLWVYFVAGVAKLGGGWNPLVQGFGTLGRVLSDPHMGNVDADAVATIWPITTSLTFGTLLFEAVAPAWIAVLYWARTKDRPGFLRRWSNRLHLRTLFFVSGVGLHLGIASTMHLGIFPWGCLAFYPLLIWPDEWSRFWQRLTRRFRRGGGPRAVASGAAATPPP